MCYIFELVIQVMLRIEEYNVCLIDRFIMEKNWMFLLYIYYKDCL